MDILINIIFVLFSAVAVSYGWGMRGTIIGGEKGAMLPGAMMGFLIALFSGSEVLSASPLVLAGAGAVAMYCGGNMTYGETLHLSMGEKNSPTLTKGLIALFVKGGIWFGIFGGLISLFISAVSGYYELWQILAFFGALPLFAVAFYFLLNKPHDLNKNKFPKIYFSIKRRESWGGLFGILAEIITFAAIFKDWSCLAMILGSFLSGAVGWVIAQIMQIKGKYPNKNGKHLFDKLYRKNALETWKLMECVLGAAGGMGCSLTFILAKPLFSEKLASIDANGYYSLIPENKITFILFIAYLVILAVDSIQYFVVPSDTDRYWKYMKLCSNTEFAVYSIIPLIFMTLGSFTVAKTVAIPVVMLVLAQEFCEKFNKRGFTKPMMKIPLFMPFIIVFIIFMVKEAWLGAVVSMIIYTIHYESGFFTMKNIEEGHSNLSPGEKTVHTYFITCCVLIIIISILIQGEIICLKM